MKKTSPPRRQRGETDQFRSALIRLRAEQSWTQPMLAARLGVSERTLSNWECGYWLPPFKQRLHLVLSLRDVPPEYVLEVADGLGVSANPALAPFLEPYRDALRESSPEDVPPPVATPPLSDAPPPPPAAPPRVPPDPERLRGAMDALVREAGDAMNVLASDLRATVSRMIGACAQMGATLEEMGEAVAVRKKKVETAGEE